MTTTNWYESNFRYTGPIRFFQANDPYYYEVDNIPLKQLDENASFLKDQVEGLLKKTASIEIDRGGFTELQPYVNGTDSVVRVRPGKYSARINDAYSIDPVQFLTQVLGFTNLQANSWRFETNLGASVSAVLEQLKSNLEEDALNFNGLAERALTWPMESNDRPFDLIGSATAGYTGSLIGQGGASWPNFTGQAWTNGVNPSSLERHLVNPGSFTGGDFNAVNKAESLFVKRWRGVVRTSIVDVPNELTIEVPKFDEQDFFYKDENGEKVLLDSNQRIDLVFIYSKAIDQNTTTVASYANGSPTTLTAPALGIVKGAGVGMSQRVHQGDFGTDLESIQSEDGIPLMLPHIADENSVAGFSGTLKGSFPSPDDLMNLAPLLSENLESNSLALIGQSILPVAYIVVKKTATLNSANVPIIATNDLIDIRPFFRTTELAYNERGGIAAATPQISLANPVASEGYVDATVRDVQGDYNGKINAVNQQLSIISSPKIVGSGMIKGGFFYGVESVLGDYVRQNNGINEASQAKTAIISKHGYPTGTVIPDFPDWDISEWCRRGSYEAKGSYPNDRINFHVFHPGSNDPTNLPFGAYKEHGFSSEFGQATRERISTLGTDGVAGGPQQGNFVSTGHSCIYFVKKTIQIDRSQIQWAGDYHVDVQLQNCAPLSCRAHKDGANTNYAAHASVWVDKRQDSFTIFASWVASDQHNQTSPGVSEPGNAASLPYLDRNNGQRFAGFSVINEDMLLGDYALARTPGESSAGVAIYPTVSFQVYGIPTGFSANAVNLNSENPVMTLV